MKQKNHSSTKNPEGFTLIELLVVIAISALLSSVALIAFMSARQKGRDAKRVSDMVQMSTALELYFATNKGYPSATAGVPTPLVPSVASSLPKIPTPPDGGCENISYNTVYGAPASGNGDTYVYYPSGTSYVFNGATVFPDYAYYFCLGNTTGNLSPGPHRMTPKGLK